MTNFWRDLKRFDGGAIWVLVFGAMSVLSLYPWVSFFAGFVY